MRYKNAKDILPKDVLALIQEYTDGEYIYIPKKSRKSWGENTNSKAETQKRNNEIFAKYKAGSKTRELANEYFLSEKSIEQIITMGRRSP